MSKRVKNRRKKTKNRANRSSRKKKSKSKNVITMPPNVWDEVVRRHMEGDILDVIEQFKGDTDLVANWMIAQGLIKSVDEVKPRE